MLISALSAEKGHAVFSIDGQAKVGRAVELMARKNIGAIIVVDRQGALKGVLSEREIVSGLASHGASILDAPVHVWLRRDAPTVTPDTRIQDAMALMTAARAGRVPVVDRGRIVGVLSVGDLLKSRLAEKTQENLVLMDVARWPPAAVA